MKIKLSYIMESPVMDNELLEKLIENLTKTMQTFSKDNNVEITNIKVKDVK